MKRFLNNRTRHATTALVLIAWLFAIASGIANACLLQDARANRSNAHSHAAGIEASPHAHAQTDTERSGDATDIDGDADQSLAAKALCLDACEERTHCLLKQNSSLDQPDLPPPTVFAVVWIASQSVVSTVRLDRDNHADPFGIPIRVRYSRLTL